MPHLKLEPAIRREILAKLRAALREGSGDDLFLRRCMLEVRYPGMFEEAREHQAATEFASCLEEWASNLAEWGEQRGEREPEQRRKEKLAAVANAMDALLVALDKADDLSLGHAMRSGLASVTPSPKVPRPTIEKAKALLRAALRHGSFGGLVKAFGLKLERPKPFAKANLGAQKLNLMRARWLARDMQDIYLSTFRQFSEGFRASIAALPPISTDLYSPEYRVAEAIVWGLDRLHIEVTTSDTGLAGTTFTATLELAGLHAPRAGYWLRKAKESARERRDE